MWFVFFGILYVQLDSFLSKHQWLVWNFTFDYFFSNECLSDLCSIYYTVGFTKFTSYHTNLNVILLVSPKAGQYGIFLYCLFWKTNKIGIYVVVFLFQHLVTKFRSTDKEVKYTDSTEMLCRLKLLFFTSVCFCCIVLLSPPDTQTSCDWCLLVYSALIIVLSSELLTAHLLEAQISCTYD